MGFGSFLKDVAGGLVSSIPIVGPAISKGIGLTETPSLNLTGVAGDYLSHQLIGRPSAEEAYAQSKFSTAEAYRRNVDFYKNRYRWMMEDMKRAGLNPILAAASGMSTSMSPQASPATGFQARSPYGTFASSARDIAQSGLFRQKTKESMQSVRESRARQGLLSMEERKAWTELDRISAQIVKFQDEIELIRKQKELTEAQRRRENEIVELTKKQTNRLIAEISKLRKIANVYDVPYLGASIAAINEILGSVPAGLLIGVGAGFKGKGKGVNPYPGRR